MPKEYRISAIVVTYNRLSLLKECIYSLRAQTIKLDEILVINNSSTDGTLEWLNEQKDLTVITQTNSGGAGGFYTGIKTAYEKGHDWFWCMDDDGYPLNNCLEELVSTIKKDANISVVGPLVIPELNSNFLSFQTPLFDKRIKTNLTLNVDEIKKRSEDNVFNNHAVFFNGILISKKTISKVGFPDKKFFIYGDEVEYYQRIKKVNLKICTNIEALFIHPMNKFIVNNFCGQDIYIGEFNWRAYLYIRNRIYIHRCRGHGFHFKYLLSQVLYLVKLGKIPTIKLVLLAYLHGIKNNFEYDFMSLL